MISWHEILKIFPIKTSEAIIWPTSVSWDGIVNDYIWVYNVHSHGIVNVVNGIVFTPNIPVLLMTQMDLSERRLPAYQLVVHINWCSRFPDEQLLSSGAIPCIHVGFGFRPYKVKVDHTLSTIEICDAKSNPEVIHHDTFVGNSGI